MRTNLRSILYTSFFASALLICCISAEQVTKTISGMVVSDFKTPQGTIRVSLPDDISPGETISGNVIIAPEGKTDKEQKKNLESLREMSVQFPGWTTTLQSLLKDNNSNSFTFNVPSQITTTDGINSEMNLLDKKKNNIGVSEIPVNAVRLTAPDLPNGMIKLESPLITKDQPYLVLRSPNANLNNYEFQLKDKRGAIQTLIPECSSPNVAVIELPPNTSIGTGTIMVHPKGSMNSEVTKNFRYALVQADYQILKDNLQKNETTILSGNIQGLDPEVHHDPTLVLENLSNTTILLQGGNIQPITIMPSADGQFSFERLITGITPGRFSINATLNPHPKDLSDPFKVQMLSLKTVDEFNNWLKALEYDLNNFLQAQPNNKAGEINRQNTQSILENIKPCNDLAKLENQKLQTDNMLGFLAIDPKQLETWDCSFVSGASAMIPLRDLIINKTPTLVDYDMLNEFSENIQMRGEMAGYNRSLGPLINPLLLKLAIMQTYTSGTEAYYRFHQELYHAISNAAGALPDLYLPKYNRPDPSKDFIGLLDPAKKTLWATREDIPGIIASLHAVKKADNVYTFTGQNIVGASVSCSFTIVPSSVAQINLLFKPLADIILNGVAAGANQNKDSIDNKKDSTGKNQLATTEKKKDSTGPFVPGYRIRQDTDRTSGTIYRFYKNAKCSSYNDEYMQGAETNEGKCIPETSRRLVYKPAGMSDEDYINKINKESEQNKKWDHDPFATEEYETGRYIKHHYSPVSKCAKGTTTCTEVLIIWDSVSIYDDADCTQLVGTYIGLGSGTGGRRFSCR